MIMRHTVTWLTATISHNSSGMVTKAWSVLKKTRADVQPKSLTENDAKLFGISNQQSNAKKVFIKKDQDIIEGVRMVYGGALFDVRVANEWVSHMEIIAIPVLGESWAG